MSQGLRDMLANRRFAIPLIILLAFCFIGLLLTGIVLILRPGMPARQPVAAKATFTPMQAPTSSVPPTVAAIATKAPIAKPTPTLVPVGTSVSSGGSQETSVSVTSVAATPTTGGQAEATSGRGASAGGGATAQPTPAAGASQQQEPTPPADEDELADTGVGWGLVLASSIGLAGLAFAAHRFRMAN